MDERSRNGSRGSIAGATVRRLHEDRLLQEGLELLRAEAHRLWQRLGRAVELEELEAIAHPTLVELTRSYDPDRAPFAAYATLRLRWAMLDGVRRQTHGRIAAGRARALGASERIAEARRERASPLGPSADEAASRGNFRSLLQDHAGAMAVALVAAHGDLTAVAAVGESPEDATMRRDAARQLRDAVGQLPAQERELVEGHYFDDERFDRMAERLGISKSWASRLHARAIRTLAGKLRRAGSAGSDCSGGGSARMGSRG